MPHRLLEAEVRPHVVMVWLQIAGACPTPGQAFRLPHATIVARAGWSNGKSSSAALSRRVGEACKELVRLGVLQVTWSYSNQHSVPLFTVIPTSDRYEQMPRADLATITAAGGLSTSFLAKHLLVYRQILLRPQRAGQVVRLDAGQSLSKAQIADATGTGRDSTTMIRNQLADLGLLHIQDASGAAPSIALAPRPHDLEEPRSHNTSAALPAASEPPPDFAGHPHRISQGTPTESRRHKEQDQSSKTVLQDMGSVRSTVTSAERANTPAAPSTPIHITTITPDHTDPGTHQARQLANQLLRTTPQLQELHPRLRGQIRQAFIHDWRLYPDRDPETTLRAIRDELALAADGGPLASGHVGIIRGVLHRWQADRLAVTSPLTTTEFTGPDLETLAARHVPDRALPVDDIDATQAMAAHLASLTLEALYADPNTDPAHALQRSRALVADQHPERAQLWMFAAAKVRAAYRVSLELAARGETTAEPDEEIITQALASLAQCG